MRGALIVDVGAKDLEAARAVLARAVASGALGVGREVKIVLTSDGRATYELSLARLETVRAAEAAMVAAAVAAAATLGWSLPFWVALPVGAVAGVAWVALRLRGDRARVRRQIRALVASLPALLDARLE
ncbi:MAG: hypothetical protein JWN44_7236 [Myxococcales bacterium]|nr:hypothetical protein [Myxococcales bacterium]